jgi:hypothetical protein
MVLLLLLLMPVLIGLAGLLVGKAAKITIPEFLALEEAFKAKKADEIKLVP